MDVDTGLIMEDSLQIGECGGNIPRQFKVDPTNTFMFVCNQFGLDETGWPGTNGTLGIFRIDHGNGGMLQMEHVYDARDLGYEAVGLSWIDFLHL